MKNNTLLVFFILIGSMYFEGCVTINNPANSGNTPAAMKSILIDNFSVRFVKDNVTGADLTGVTVTKLRGATFVQKPYNAASIGFQVEDGDELIFSKAGKESVKISINKLLDLTGIGIFMYPPQQTPQNQETITGTVTGPQGIVPSLHMHVGPAGVTTNQLGIYTHDANSADFFNIIFYGKLTGRELTVLTANTNNDGGKTVIDVAFDETGVLTELY